MTRKQLTTTALVLTLAGLPLLAAAQGQFHKGGCGGGFFGGHGPGIERLVDHASVFLDLSEEQEAQLGAIVEASRPEMEALREQAVEARQLFHQTFDPAAFDEAAVTAFAQSQSDIHTQMMVLGLRTFSEVWSVLTPEQQEQLEEMRGQMQERHQNRGKGGPHRR